MGERKQRQRELELTSSLAAAPHIHKLTLRKNDSIYLPFPSIYLPNSIHQYLSFPRGFRHVQQFILLNYISVRGWREARLQMLTLTWAQHHEDAATTQLLDTTLNHISCVLWLPSLCLQGSDFHALLRGFLLPIISGHSSFWCMQGKL